MKMTKEQFRAVPAKLERYLKDPENKAKHAMYGKQAEAILAILKEDE